MAVSGFFILFFYGFHYIFGEVVYLQLVGAVHNESHFLWLRESLKIGFPDLCLWVEYFYVILEVSSEQVNVI